ncbi:hypothetical protein BZG36_01684 [Bifiguratus adelaidae]|uniref:USP domain-containing protein n=1 Tax=Bifiguratus adelaidae TaxID=1938954 RepID=A0A261Y532_9FUNG|nr:hypothetical protein BZG36_01684 [Bifiguratus adelaidae]
MPPKRSAPAETSKAKRTKAEIKNDLATMVETVNGDDDEVAENGVTESVEAVPVSRDLYLDTVDRHMLDFDFEKVCSVSLSNLNVYACLFCGKYFQGRGKSSHAYFHSLHEDHHVFINLHTLKVYVLPDNYEVTDPSLNDIKYVLHPTFTKAQVEALDSETKPSYDLNNRKYLPGFVGLNNVKANDYVNVVIQALIHIPQLRDYFILEDHEAQNRSQLVLRFGELVRKMWNPRAFKGQVSPHELLQEIMNASNRRFKLSEQADPVEFLSWFLNTLHRDLGGGKKKNSSIIYKTFQGEVKVETRKVAAKDADSHQMNVDQDEAPQVTKSPFLFLALDLPPMPLYQDEDEKNIIPHELAGSIKRYHITRLPQYIIFQMKRFAKNPWVSEKNTTIVEFPLKHLDLRECVEQQDEAPLSTQYDLLANICHEGQPGVGKGVYKVHVKHRGTEQWYQIQDLIVEVLQPEMIFLSESYIQVGVGEGR